MLLQNASNESNPIPLKEVQMIYMEPMDDRIEKFNAYLNSIPIEKLIAEGKKDALRPLQNSFHQSLEIKLDKRHMTESLVGSGASLHKAVNPSVVVEPVET
ncbi:MAG: hypothetical protein Q8Q94_03425, partial [bacterium]|nr:hypothetical protein [bacterium]